MSGFLKCFSQSWSWNWYVIVFQSRHSSPKAKFIVSVPFVRNTSKILHILFRKISYNGSSAADFFYIFIRKVRFCSFDSLDDLFTNVSYNNPTLDGKICNMSKKNIYSIYLKKINQTINCDRNVVPELIRQISYPKTSPAGSRLFIEGHFHNFKTSCLFIFL